MSSLGTPHQHKVGDVIQEGPHKGKTVLELDGQGRISILSRAPGAGKGSAGQASEPAPPEKAPEKAPPVPAKASGGPPKAKPAKKAEKAPKGKPALNKGAVAEKVKAAKESAPEPDPEIDALIEKAVEEEKAKAKKKQPKKAKAAKPVKAPKVKAPKREAAAGPKAKEGGDPKYLDLSVPVPPGKVRSQGGGMTDEQVEEARKLRRKDPDGYTWRRLALAFGTTATNVMRRTKKA